ncbi:DNA helicase [Tanacetum coccineum]
MVEGLIHFLDAYNELVQLFQTARDKCKELDIPEFMIRLYSATSNTLGEIVFESGITSNTDFDVVIQHGDGPTQKSKQVAPFVYVAAIIPSFHLRIVELQFRLQQYDVIFKGGRLFQQYVVGERDGYEVGGRIILPMSFTGGSRYMYAHYLDALSISDVCRVFEQKIQSLVTFLKKERIFGNVTVDSASRIRSAEDVYQFISAELPDPRIDSDGYNIVSKMMMHAPCRAANLKAPCMKGDKCGKNFPKKINSKTFFNDNGHVHYQRRDTSISTTRNQFKLDNSYVVPYNRDLLLAFRAHINVEYCGWIPWRILKFEIHHRERAVQILAVYLEDMQRITFRDRDRLRSVVDIPAACEALGLLGDDTEWEIALEEACVSATPEELSHDIPKKVPERVHIPNYHLNADSLQGYTLYEIEVILNNRGKSLQRFGLPPPPEDLLAQLANRLLIEERNYNREELIQQKNDSELLFVYGHGGTGKPFLWKTIISTLRSQGKIVLAVTSSGIASLLLPSGRIAHSRFKLPLELTEEFLCRITKNTQLGKLLAHTDLIIWDEAPMNDRRYFEALDRSLRDIVNTPSSLFGGKLILLGGYFWQTLLVKKEASKMEVIAPCISESALWPSFKVFKLKQNMRLARPDIISLEERSLVNSFASWLLDIGDGKTGLSKLIDFIYDHSTLHTPSATTLQHKSIVCPNTETTDIINSEVLDMVPSESTTYMSQDKATPTGNDGAKTEMPYPIEHLNTLKLPGFPPHHLELKVGAPVTLLRNVNLAGGLCNGTRMIVRQLMTKLIEVQIITGTRV